MTTKTYLLSSLEVGEVTKCQTRFFRIVTLHYSAAVFHDIKFWVLFVPHMHHRTCTIFRRRLSLCSRRTALEFFEWFSLLQSDLQLDYRATFSTLQVFMVVGVLIATLMSCRPRTPCTIHHY